MLDKNSESRSPRRSHRGAAAAGQEHRLRAGAHGPDRGQGADPVLHHSRRADRGRGVRHRPHQDRQLAEPAVPLQFQGLQAVRGRDQALPGDRIRRAGRGRGQDAAGAREPRKAARHGHRPATGRGRARSGLAVLGAPGAGARQAAGGAVPAGSAGGRRLRQVRRDRQSQRDHSRQAAVGRRHAGADRAVARTERRLQQRSRQGGRRNAQDHGRRSLGQRSQRAALRRSGDAARDPQRGQARRADLQHPRHPGRLHHRDHLLPQDIVHGRRGLPADHRDPARARRPRLGQFQPQHVPERDDAAHHGDQLLRLDAADLRRARPPDRGPGQIHRVQERRAGGRARPAC